MGCIKVSVVLVLAVAVMFQLFRKELLENRMMKGTAPWAVANDNFKVEDIPDLSGKLIVVTGANVGLGKSTAKFLALNGATTILGCRTVAKGSGAAEEIVKELINEKRIKASDGARVRALLIPMELELDSLASVKKFAEQVLNKYPGRGLNSLILNAGVMHTTYGLTKDGVEQQWGINHLGHFYLAKMLTNALKKGQPSTVVAVSSNGQFGSYPNGVSLSLKEINDQAAYNAVLAYGQSKLSNVLFAQELAARFKAAGDKVYVNSLNPGAVSTELARQYPEFFQSMFKSLTKRFPDAIVFESDTGARTQLFAAVSPKVFHNQITGTYMVPFADPCEPSDHAKNATLQKALWAFSDQLLRDKGFT